MKKLDGTTNQPFPMKNLTAIRKHNKKTQKGLSVQLGFSEELISKYERGLSNPSISSLKKIANYFHCSVDYLIELTDNPSPHLNISQNDAEFLIKYHSLSDIDKSKLCGYLDSLLDKNK